MSLQAMKAHVLVLKDQLESARQDIENYDNLLVYELELQIHDLEACIEANLTEESLGI